VKYAICNELFEGWKFADVCRTIRELGYTGIEIAPFTLTPLVTNLTDASRREIRRQAADEGVEIVGLHWLFAKTEGLLFTSTDWNVRRRTGEYLAELAKSCGELDGKLLVLGSPGARKIPDGVTREQAEDYFIDAVRWAFGALEANDVQLLLEPLGPVETDFMNTADEGETIRRRLGHPNVALHLDVKAMSTEPTSIPDIIRKHASQMKHFHANDPNKRGPGMGEVKFEPIFQALKDVDYQGWVSVEVFDFTPDPVTIARESIAYMKRVEDSLS
jgi:sugar phosphate isomerase/epimerase